MGLSSRRTPTFPSTSRSLRSPSSSPSPPEATFPTSSTGNGTTTPSLPPVSSTSLRNSESLPTLSPPPTPRRELPPSPRLLRRREPSPPPSPRENDHTHDELFQRISCETYEQPSKRVGRAGRPAWTRQ